MKNKLNTEAICKTLGKETADKFLRTLTENTAKSYTSLILSFFEKKELADITIAEIQAVNPDDANRWAGERVSNGIAKSSVNNALAALKAFYDFLGRRHIKLVEYNPFAKEEGCIRYPNAQKDFSDHRTISDEEMTRMLKIAKASKGILGLRNELIILMLATTGMRRDEIIHLNIENVYAEGDIKKCRIYGKGQKVRVIRLADVVYDMIEEYVGRRHLTMKAKNMPLFISHSSNAEDEKRLSSSALYKLIKTVAQKAGLDPELISPHTFRHTNATTSCVEYGDDIKTIQDRLGHSSISTTTRYINATKLDKDCTPNNQTSKLMMYM